MRERSWMCSGEVVAGGDEDFAAAEDGAAVDGLLNGGGVFCGAVAGGSVVADIEGEGRVWLGLWVEAWIWVGVWVVSPVVRRRRGC